MDHNWQKRSGPDQLVACVKCLEEKPIHAFYMAPGMKGGHMLTCKTCGKRKNWDGTRPSPETTAHRRSIEDHQQRMLLREQEL